MLWLPDENGPWRGLQRASRAFLCEGWGTAKTVHAATGQAVCAAFNAGNLLDVAKAIRAQWPALRLTIAGDDDRTSDSNPGRAKAEEAARAAGAEVIFPAFPPGAAGSDWNDLAKLAGLAAVTEALADDVGPGPRLSDWHACEVFAGEPPPREWLVSGVFPAGRPALLAAAGGIGKSFLLLDLARAVAGGALNCSLGMLARMFHKPADTCLGPAREFWRRVSAGDTQQDRESFTGY